FTFCPDICPTALQNMSEALDMLGSQARAIQPLFVTVDPKRDTVEQMVSYKRNFHKAFVMLTGNKDQVDSAKKAYKVYAALAPNDGSSTDDLIDHSSIIYLMDRSGKFVAHFNHETPASEIVRGIRAAF
ncbi:MAG: SCO family protein, partial [bacterium]|nr:SCO family protein [bacterium]